MLMDFFIAYSSTTVVTGENEESQCTRIYSSMARLLGESVQ